MRRLVLIVRSRWWAFLLVGLVGMAAGYLFASIRNANIEPRFESEASVVLLRQSDDESGRELQGRLSEAQRAAIRVNGEVLEAGTAEIRTEVGETEGVLLFVGYGGTGEDAGAIALGMRDDYLETAPVGVEAVEEELAQYADEVAEIRAQISELGAEQQTEDAVDPAVSLLSAELAELQQRAVQLAVDLALYEFRDLERERTDIEAELETVRLAIVETQAQLDALQPDPEVNTDRDLRVQALQQQEAELTQEYLDLFLNQAEVAEITSLGVVETTEVSATPVSPRLGAVGGFLLGLLVSLAAALLYDLLRKPIWSPADITTVPVLGSLSPRRLSPGALSWYGSAHGGRRIGDIQAIRASLEGTLGDRPVAVASARLGGSAKEHKAAVADLASSLAAVGKTVLLIDADFGSPSTFPEFESGGPTLARLLTVDADDAVFRVAVKETLEGLRAVVPGLWGLSAGDLDRRPADVVGSRRFDALVRESKEIADIVLLVTPEAAEPATLTIAQRVDELFLVAKARSTTIPHLETVVDALGSRRARFLGAVLLDRRREGVAKLRSRGAHIRRS